MGCIETGFAQVLHSKLTDQRVTDCLLESLNRSLVSSILLNKFPDHLLKNKLFNDQKYFLLFES